MCTDKVKYPNETATSYAFVPSVDGQVINEKPAQFWMSKERWESMQSLKHEVPTSVSVEYRLTPESLLEGINVGSS